jgi:hypothetical protein
MSEMWFRKKKIKAEHNMKCPYCNLECFDPVSLERHISWAHKDAKPKV